MPITLAARLSFANIFLFLPDKREIMRRLGLAGNELPSSLEGFVEQHLGPDRELTWRLA
jgi:hypothetical protein